VDPTLDPGISVFFTVEIDGVELGSWTTCSGLGISMASTPRGDSAMSFWMHHIPGHVTYNNITLGRPVSPDTVKIMTWMNSFSLLPIPTAAAITAQDPMGGTIMTWSLWGVIPVRWTGPSFDAASPRVATEQIEIAFQGFL
jgi:phage tail-like protein